MSRQVQVQFESSTVSKCHLVSTPNDNESSSEKHKMLCSYLCIVCVGGLLCGDAQTCMGIETRGKPWVSFLYPQVPSILCFNEDLLAMWSSLVSLDCLLREPPGIYLSFPGNIRIITTDGSFFFLKYGSWESNSGLRLELQAFHPPSYLPHTHKKNNTHVGSLLTADLCFLLQVTCLW